MKLRPTLLAVVTALTLSACLPPPPPGPGGPGIGPGHHIGREGGPH